MRTLQRERTLRGVFAVTLLVAGLAAGPAHALRPIVFVHGGSGSGAQYETQAMRFASNGYPASYVRVHEYDSIFSHQHPGADLRGPRRARRRAARRDGRRQGRPARPLARHHADADLPERLARARRQDRALRQHRRRDRAPRRPAASPRSRSGGWGIRRGRSSARRTCTSPTRRTCRWPPPPSRSRRSTSSSTARRRRRRTSCPSRASSSPAAWCSSRRTSASTTRRSSIFEVDGATGARLDDDPNATYSLGSPGRRLRALRGRRRPALRVPHPARRLPARSTSTPSPSCAATS